MAADNILERDRTGELDAREWLQQGTVAIRGRVSLSVLFDVIQPFPTFSEAFLATLSDLEARTVKQRESTPPIPA